MSTSNYKQSDIAGTQWVRVRSVDIQNPYAGNATVTFKEEKIAQVGTEAINIPFSAQPLFDVINPEREINLINPATGEPIGQVVTEGFLYMAIFSKYMELAKKRDLMEDQMKMVMNRLSAEPMAVPEGGAQ